MPRKIIKLTTEKELKIFMNPLRQRLLRTFEIEGAPLTAKGIADRMKITAPSAKHHITQLESIGLIEPDHTELIHGITAQYYKLSDVEIRLGVDDASFQTEKDIIMENLIMSVLQDFQKNLHETDDISSIGDCHTGVVHLKETQLQELKHLILSFIKENRNSDKETTPYEFALIYTKVKNV